jgi:hypothetical protein
VQAVVTMRERLDEADGVAATLSAGWDTFDLIQQIADGCAADPDSGLFAAFLLAAGAAGQGRDAVGFAPSIPANSDPVDERGDETDPATAAADLAALAIVLRTRLEAAAAQAGNLGDLQACRDAARAAARVREYLDHPNDGHAR